MLEVLRSAGREIRAGVGASLHYCDEFELDIASEPRDACEYTQTDGCTHVTKHMHATELCRHVLTTDHFALHKLPPVT